jgi:hypothetical protein
VGEEREQHQHQNCPEPEDVEQRVLCLHHSPRGRPRSVHGAQAPLRRARGRALLATSNVAFIRSCRSGVGERLRSPG